MHLSVRALCARYGALLHRLLLGLVAGFAILAPISTLAAPDIKSPVRLKVSPVIPRGRSHAPQIIEVVLSHQFKQMVEGVLELRFYVGRRLVLEYDSLPLVVTNEPQRFQITIPPITVHNDKTPVTVIGRLISSREVFELGEHDIVVPSYWKRWFVLGISRPDERAAFPQGFPIETALAFERFNPNPSDRNELVTYPTSLPPEFFSTNPVAYMPFDILVLEGDGFIQLREPQLQAIAGWVEAGGSVLVYPTGTLKPMHLAFLNRMAGGAEKAYQADERNRLDVSAHGEIFGRYYTGLGRTVIRHFPQEPEEDPANPEWVETAAFLWKFRHDQAEMIRTWGTWAFEVPVNTMSSFDYRKPRLYAPQEPSIDKPLRELLIPAQVQGIPFWVVAGILAVFLAVIAPIDYFLLGAFRARRYTWFTLTAASLAFTVGTVRIAERIMGNVDYRQAFVFVDLGDQGKPVRNSRYEVLFTATQRVLESSYQNSLYVPADNRIPRYDPRRTTDGYYASPIDDLEEQAPFPGLESDLPLYSGRVPSNYAIQQQLRQWSPAISRQTSFDNEIAVPELNWKRLDPLEWAREPDGWDETIDWEMPATPARPVQNWTIPAKAREALRAEIGRALPGARVLLFHGSRCCDLTDVTFSLDASVLPKVEAAPSIVSTLPPGYTDPGGFPAVLSDPHIELVKRVALRPARGFFSLVCQIGPDGSDGFEDLSLVDSSNLEEWLLVIVVHKNDDWVVYRKLYRGKP